MKQPDQHYQQKIDHLREQMGYDFVSLAFAQSAADDFVITWQFAAGNLNQRYRRIVLQSGKGIAGLVFKTGKSMFVSSVADELNGQELYEFPIIVSERLQSLAAIPLYQYDRVAGVLLAGYRTSHKMTKQTFHDLLQCLNGQFGAFAIKELTFR